MYMWSKFDHHLKIDLASKNRDCSDRIKSFSPIHQNIQSFVLKLPVCGITSNSRIKEVKKLNNQNILC